MTSNDLNDLRARLLEHERQRPGRGSSTTSWEGGRGWRRAFDELAAGERARDALFAAQVDAAPVGTGAAAERLAAWGRAVAESVSWYERLLSFLSTIEQVWGADRAGRSGAPEDLRDHIARVELQLAACYVREALIRLEDLEHQRRAEGGLGEGRWQRAFQELHATFRGQAAVYAQRRPQDPPDRLYAERLAACQRIRDLQQGTIERWRGRSDVDRGALRQDAAALDRFMDTLRPRSPERPRVPIFLAAAALFGVVLALLLYGRGATTEPPAANTTDMLAQAGVAQPAAPAPIEVQGQLRSTAPIDPSLEAGGEAIAFEEVTEPPATRGTGALAREGAPPAIQGQARPATPIFLPLDAEREAVAFNLEGRQLRASGSCDEAARAFDAAIAADPAWYEPYSNLAFCLYDLGQAERAIQSWRRALDRNAHSPDANAGLGMALAAQGDLAAGRRLYGRAVELDPNYRDAAWLAAERGWSERAIADSAALRLPAPE